MYFDDGKEKGMGKWLALEVKMRCRQWRSKIVVLNVKMLEYSSVMGGGGVGGGFHRLLTGLM